MTIEDIGWLVGRKEICRYLRVKDWRTVKKMINELGLPVLLVGNFPPKALRAELDNWLSSFRDRVNKLNK